MAGPLTISRESETNLKSYILAVSWPWAHPAPELQHQSVDRSLYAPYAEGSYTGYLLYPPAPVYTQQRPVEVEWYARLFREAWWQNEFRKFGHQALKLVPPPNALIVMSTDDSLMDAELERELGQTDYGFIRGMASPLL